MNFDNSYTSYWKQRVNNSSDGTIIADENILLEFMPLLNVLDSEKILDIGCSFGRFYGILSKFSNFVYGIDIEATAIAECLKIGYTDLKVCPAEKIDYEDEYFEKAICWGTFDLVSQEKTLTEINRVLKIGGRVLITGKNINYLNEDYLAFIAERNAKIKKFPNHFTDINKLINKLPNLGFEVHELLCFERRGDFGKNICKQNLINLKDPFYEYLLVLTKTQTSNLEVEKFSYNFSKTAKTIFKNSGYKGSIINFFKWHSENNEIL